MSFLCCVRHERRLDATGLSAVRLTKSQIITPGQYYCVSGKVNSADKLYLVVESVKPDNKRSPRSTALVPADGVGGSAIG